MRFPFKIPGDTRVSVFACSDSLLLAATAWDLYCFNLRGVVVWRKSLESSLKAIDIAKEAGLAVAAMGDGTIRWIRIGDGEEVLSLFIREDLREWAVWSPAGYWEASTHGSSLLGWFAAQGIDREDRVFDLNLFHREREGICELGELGKKKAKKPFLQIVNPHNNDTVADTLIVLEVKVNDSGSVPVLSLGLEVNGVAQMTTFRGLVPRYRRTIHQIPVILSGGENKVVLKAYTDDYVLVSDITLLCRPLVENRSYPKPTLHVLLAGISRYRDEGLNLEYGAAGASDISEEMIRQKGGLYMQVETRLLLDSSASRGAVINGMEWLKGRAENGDVSVLYFAGHGVYDEERKAYFIPFDGDTGSLRRSCIPFSEIRYYVERIPGKVILFLDACYSGVIASKVRSFFPDLEGAVGELLSAEAGCIIFSSSSAFQFSQEDRMWGNSAFTRALLEALQGKADMSGDGIITSGMLELYVSERVRELTGGTQTPVIAKPYAMRDFPFALIPQLRGERQ